MILYCKKTFSNYFDNISQTFLVSWMRKEKKKNGITQIMDPSLALVLCYATNFSLTIQSLTCVYIRCLDSVHKKKKKYEKKKNLMLKVYFKVFLQ